MSPTVSLHQLRNAVEELKKNHPPGLPTAEQYQLALDDLVRVLSEPFNKNDVPTKSWTP